MTLNYQMMLQRHPNVKEDVGGSIFGTEMFALPNGKTSHVIVSYASGVGL